MSQHLRPHLRPRRRVLRWLTALCLLALSGISFWFVRVNPLPIALAQTSTTGFDGGKLGRGAAGTTHTYSHTLSNKTPQPQTFSLAVESSKGFTTSVTPPTVLVPPGQSTTVSVEVVIPNDAAPGTLDVTTLTATNSPPAAPLTLRVKDTTLSDGTTALKIPAALYGTLAGGQRVYDMTMGNGTTEFWPGVATPTSGYNGSYLGPTLVMTTSETVLVNITNNLTETTTNHWHGLHLPGEMDGGPHQGIEPGTTWRPTWTVMNEASTMWYHPHPHGTSGHHTSASSSGTTGTQVYSGLAGMILIRDSNSTALGLPQTYGVDEFPLVFQDRRFNQDGSFNANPNERGHRKGDAFLVNGTLAGHLQAPAQMVRLHLLNGSNFRFYNFGFSDNRSFYQIASDNALLNAPVQRNRVQMGPGERIELVVDLSGAEGQTLEFATFNGELGDTLAPNHTADDYDRSNFVLFTMDVVAATSNAVTTLPSTLNSITRLERSAATAEHRLTLMIPPSINGATFEMETINITSTLNSVEVWSIINASDEPHPLHIHGVPFQILVRAAPVPVSGQPLPPGGTLPPDYEMGWKDTVIVKAGERVDLIRYVADYADPSAPFMYHCHLLEHEDKGMMGQFIVEDTTRNVYLPAVLR